MNFKPVWYLHLTIFFTDLVASVTSTNTDSNVTSEMEAYGKTWMYFPDGDGIPRRISLQMPPSEFLRRSFWEDDEGGIEYRLYTKYNKDEYVLLDDSANPINKTDPKIIENLRKMPLKVVTHGWESSADNSVVTNIKNAYLDTGDVNVIGVNWGYYATNLLYVVVAAQTASPVGNSVGKFLDALSNRYSIPGCRIHLIGHSLGAHVMGNAASRSKVKINRITGLDPARPGFELPEAPHSCKLDASDAKFVDVIHTCAYILGVEEPIGHADFFPNSGWAPQPGCFDLNNLWDQACSHSRSHQLFVDSIRHPFSLPAYPCSNWTYFNNEKCKNSTTFLGEYARRNAKGTFFLKTNSEPPYGLGLTNSTVNSTETWSETPSDASIEATLLENSLET